MTSTLYIGGRPVAGQVHRSETDRLGKLCARCGAAKGRSGYCGARCDGVTPGTPAEPEPGSHAAIPGEPWVDDDGVVYRVVPDRVITAEGWNTSRSWAEKLGCTWRALEWLCKRGGFDAAVGQESGERRYRCLSPRRCKELLAEWDKREEVKRGKK